MTLSCVTNYPTTVAVPDHNRMLASLARLAQQVDDRQTIISRDSKLTDRW